MERSIRGAGVAFMLGVSFDNSLFLGVEKAYKVAPQAKIITVHMDAINHMTVTRKDMKKFVEEKGLGSRVHIPQDGEVIVTGSGKN